MPTKDSSILTVRVKNDLVEQIHQKIAKRGCTVNQWLTRVIIEGLRKHQRSVKDGNN